MNVINVWIMDNISYFIFGMFGGLIALTGVIKNMYNKHNNDYENNYEQEEIKEEKFVFNKPKPNIEFKKPEPRIEVKKEISESRKFKEEVKNEVMNKSKEWAKLVFNKEIIDLTPEEARTVHDYAIEAMIEQDTQKINKFIQLAKQEGD